jgi:carbon monoxide dehydrogenase subunit G
MKDYEASASMAATPEAIWSILTDGASYTAWHSGVDNVEARIAPGETIKVYSQASPGRTCARNTRA